MINRYSIGFVFVAAFAVAGIDYFDQSKKAGLALGELPIASYIESVPQRINASKDASFAKNAERERRQRWLQGPRVYLPEAPEGWTRRALLEGDDTAIMPYKTSNQKDTAQASIVAQFEARSAAKQAAKRAERSWIYQRGTETIFIEIAAFEKPNLNSISGMAAASIKAHTASNNRHEGYAVIAGVGFTELLNARGKRENHYRVLEGTVGFVQELRIRVHTNASRKSTEDLLRAIDYDGLNSLLTNPMKSVGNDVTPADGVEPLELAEDMHDLRLSFLSLNSREAHYRLSSSSVGAIVRNTYAQAYGANFAMTDVTENQGLALGDVVEIGYRTARAGLLEGRSPKDVQLEIQSLTQDVVSRVDASIAENAQRLLDDKAPEMSPELAKELGIFDEEASNGLPGSSGTMNLDHMPGFKVLLATDDVATNRSRNKVVSQRVEATTFSKHRDFVTTPGVFFEFTTRIAREFEQKHQLPNNSCAYTRDFHRIECDTAQETASTSIKGLLNSLSGGAGKDGQSNAKSADKPKRLQLQNGSSKGKRCVGSFCD